MLKHHQSENTDVYISSLVIFQQTHTAEMHTQQLTNSVASKSLYCSKQEFIP